MIKDIIDFVSDALSSSFDFVLEIIESFSEQKDHSINAEFGKESTLLSSSNDGLSITGDKFLTQQKSREHVLYFGPTGLGKSTVCLVPSVINIASSKKGKDASMIINDPSGENLKLRNYLIHQGYKVYSFNPNELENSIYYNPLKRIKTPSDITKVATMLVNKSSKENKDYWNLKSIELISLLISFLIENAPEENKNIANVYYLLENLASDEDTVSGLFADKSSENQWQKYKAIISNSQNTKASIISSAIASLSFIGNDKSLCSLTAIDTFDFSIMKEEKIALFLNVNTIDINYYSPLLGLFFEQLFTDTFRTIPSEKDNAIYLLIDELSSIPIPSLATVISNARKYFSILGILQSENQLFESYGQYNAKTILNNACRVYMSGLNDESEKISKALGEYQYYEDKEKKILRTRPLMTSEEIRTMDKEKVIIMPNGGLKPLLSKVKPYYKIRKYLSYMSMELPNDYEIPTSIIYEAQYLSLEEYKTQQPND